MFSAKSRVYNTLARNSPSQDGNRALEVCIFFLTIITLDHINASNMSSSRYASPSFSPLWHPFAGRRIQELIRRFQSDAGLLAVEKIKSLQDEEVETVLRYHGKKFTASPIA